MVKNSLQSKKLLVTKLYSMIQTEAPGVTPENRAIWKADRRGMGGGFRLYNGYTVVIMYMGSGLCPGCKNMHSCNSHNATV